MCLERSVVGTNSSPANEAVNDNNTGQRRDGSNNAYYQNVDIGLRTSAHHYQTLLHGQEEPTSEYMEIHEYLHFI